jgi:hypothetical protein
MKRTDLIALAERLETVSTLDGNASFEDLERAADFLRQLAESKPVAARYGWDGDGWLYLDNGSGSDWLTRHADAEPLYTLPLED